MREILVFSRSHLRHSDRDVTIATVAAAGGEAFTWMMIYAVVFFVPQALLFSELGTAFPQEGGPYYWTRLAFGHLAGAVNNFL